MQVNCKSKIGFEGGAVKVLRTSAGNQVIQDAINKYGEQGNFRVVFSSADIADIHFFNPKIETEVIEALKKISAPKIYVQGDPLTGISERVFNRLVACGNLFG